MIERTTLTLVDGVRIIVPNSLNVITTYVLVEQEDWFEDEIKFLRHLLQPGQRVIDIGANYGVYTLSMAKLVGPTGRVWAFEPASTTASFLASSIAVNGFDQIVLEQSAVSNVNGTAQLSMNINSELNELVRGDDYLGDSETVPVVTLDECMEVHDWHNIEFLKLDAEGEEASILRGGSLFFAKESPLIQYEIKAGTQLHLELVEAFKELGYRSYRLVPGLNVLVPFDENEPADSFMLNLFCCKSDRAARLAAMGFLLKTSDITRSAKANSIRVTDELEGNKKNSWFNTLSKLPYGQLCAEQWRKTMAAGQSSEVESALSLYTLSRNITLNVDERFAALEESFFRLKTLCESQPAYLRLASLARVARDYGARTLAAEALNQLCSTIFKLRQVSPSEPFLAPGERFDSVPPRNSIGNWVVAAALEELERNSNFSSIYSGTRSLQRLEIIHDLGLGSAEMTRRLRLIKNRFKTPNE